jgi:DeoR/GlpR family transcriptional regulator of sugar metabolism
MSGDERRQQVLSIIREKPDIKAREIAERTNTTPNNIYNVIRRLEAEGKLTRANGRFVVKS